MLDRGRPVRQGIARARALSARAALAGIRLAWGERAVPLDVVSALRRALHFEDALCRPYESLITSGRTLNDPHLAAALRDEQFGAWALAVETVNFLEDYIRRARPTHILELGSGLSTACIAHVLWETAGERGRVISVDQGSNFLAESRSFVDALGTGHIVEFRSVTLRHQSLDGEDVLTYGFDDDFLATIAASPPDLVIVDGPAAGVRGRYGALRLLESHLRAGTRIFVDDALRDEELTAARRWRDEGILAIDGLYVVGKGLLSGRVPQPRGTS